MVIRNVLLKDSLRPVQPIEFPFFFFFRLSEKCFFIKFSLLLVSVIFTPINFTGIVCWWT